MSSKLNNINWMCYPKKKTENFTNTVENNNQNGYDIFKEHINSNFFNFNTIQTTENFNNEKNGELETNYEIMGLQKPNKNLTFNIDSTRPVETDYKIMGMSQNLEGFTNNQEGFTNTFQNGEELSNTSYNMEVMKINFTNNNYNMENPFSSQMNVTIPTSTILNNN